MVQISKTTSSAALLTIIAGLALLSQQAAAASHNDKTVSRYIRLVGRQLAQHPQAAPPSPPVRPLTRPPPPSPLPKLPAGLPCPDQDAILNQTNLYRARHQAPPLEWSDALAIESSAYAQKLAKTCSLTHSFGKDYGENLMMVRQFPAPDRTCMVGIKSWYSEVNSYNFSTPNPYSVNWPKNVGHFTQLVWKGTTKVGCGVGIADFPMNLGGRLYNGGCKMIVCRYQRNGNIARDLDFLKNVLPNTTATTV